MEFFAHLKENMNQRFVPKDSIVQLFVNEFSVQVRLFQFWTCLSSVEGYFCPMGSVTPLPCGYLTHCPKGSDHKFFYGGIIFVASIDFLILFCVLVFKLHSRRVRNNCSRLGIFFCSFKMICSLSPNFRGSTYWRSFQF